MVQTKLLQVTQNKEAEPKTTWIVLSKFTHCSVIPDKHVCFHPRGKMFTCKLLKVENPRVADLPGCFSCNERLLWWNCAVSYFTWSTHYGLATVASTSHKDEFHQFPDSNNKLVFVFSGLEQHTGCIFMWSCWQLG